jgi:predicted MFS family arabinose efflux permease
VSGLSATLLHQIPFLLDQGISPRVASWVLGGTAAVGVIGKLGFGTLIDRYDQRRVILFCFSLQALGVSLLFLPMSPIVLALFVASTDTPWAATRRCRRPWLARFSAAGTTAQSRAA